MCIPGCPEFLPDAFETICADESVCYIIYYISFVLIHGLKMTSTLDNLPKPFVNAMRTLFDIMDDKQTGFVNFADIGKGSQKQIDNQIEKGLII